MANIFDLFKKIEKSSSAPVTHIVCGLGNPGEKYVNTRHNAGFLAVDALCQRLGVRCDRAKFKALIGEATLGDTRILIMKPQTFMNNSGEAVSEAARFYKIPPESIIIISDDIAQDVGRLRIRRSGSAGGHNGLKSIISHLKTDTFPRIRLGVGQKPSPEYDLVDWVLGKLPKETESAFSSVCSVVPDVLSLILKGDFDTAMCNYNGYIGK